MSNVFKDLQELVCMRLQEDDYFSDASAGTPKPVTVLTEKVGDIVASIDEAVNRIGISPLVMIPKVHRGARVGSLVVDVVISITENPVVNRDPQTGTGKAAQDMGKRVFELLYNWRAADMWTPMDFDSMELEVPKPLIYEVRFKTSTFVSISSN